MLERKRRQLPTAPATSDPKFAGEVEEWRGPEEAVAAAAAAAAAAAELNAGLRTTPPLNEDG